MNEHINLGQQPERVSWFRPGGCIRLIYDVLRDVPQPLATREVTRRVMAVKGIAIDAERTQAA